MVEQIDPLFPSWGPLFSSGEPPANDPEPRWEPIRVARSDVILPTRNPVEAYLARLGPSSQRTMRQSLAVLARVVWADTAKGLVPEQLAWWELRAADAVEIRSRLAVGYASRSVNRMLSALRGVLEESWRMGLLEKEEYRSTVNLPGLRGQSTQRVRLQVEEIRALFLACAEEGVAGVRDAALLALTCGTGLRVSEVRNLNLGDYTVDRGELRVRGSSPGEYTTYVRGGAREAVDHWVEVRGGRAGPLLLAISQTGKILPHRLGERSVSKILQKLRIRAHVQPFRPRHLRDSFLAHLEAAGLREPLLRAILGRTPAGMNEEQLLQLEQQKQRAIERVPIPYVRRADLFAGGEEEELPLRERSRGLFD